MASITITTSSFGTINSTLTGQAPATITIQLGTPGPQGQPGSQGPAGQTGPAGQKGDKGDTGASGAAATVSVGSTTTTSPGTSATVYNSGSSSAAVLNFGIPRGADGQTGPKGDTGSQGAKGDAATISVGTVSTGSPGSAVSVTNSGTSYAAVLNFTIPQGNTGSQGQVGNTGPQGPAGAAGDKYATTSTSSINVSNGAKTLTVGTGLAYTSQQNIIIAHDAGNHMHGVVTSYTSSSGALVADIAQHTGSGTYTSWTVNLDGGVGIQGPQGPAGDAATISVGTVTTGAAGSSASITNVGTSSAAVFNFSIPRGNTGDAGTPGIGVPVGGTVGQVVTKKSSQDYDTQWSDQSGGSTFNGGTITNPLTVLADGASSVEINPAGIIASDLTSSGSVGGTFDYAGLSLFASTNSFNVYPSYALAQDSSNGYYAVIYPNGVQAGDSSVQTIISASGVTFPDSSVQTTAANPFNGGTITNVLAYLTGTYQTYIGGTVQTNDTSTGYSATIQPNSVQTSNGYQTTIISSAGITFPDGSTQTTAATGGGGGGFVPGSGNLDMAGYDVTNANFNSSAGQVSAQNVTLSSGGSLTFGDSTVQTTAANPFNGGTITNSITVTDGLSNGFYQPSICEVVGPSGAAAAMDVSNTGSIAVSYSGYTSQLVSNGIVFSDGSYMTTAPSSGISDAPNDGNYYVRKDGTWIQAVVQSVIDQSGSQFYCLTIPF